MNYWICIAQNIERGSLKIEHGHADVSIDFLRETLERMWFDKYPYGDGWDKHKVYVKKVPNSKGTILGVKL